MTGIFPWISLAFVTLASCQQSGISLDVLIMCIAMICGKKPTLYTYYFGLLSVFKYFFMLSVSNGSQIFLLA